jgi:hypothetical protein
VLNVPKATLPPERVREAIHANGRAGRDGWTVHTSDGHARQYDVVLIANGHLTETHLPVYEGRSPESNCTRPATATWTTSKGTASSSSGPGTPAATWSSTRRTPA